MLHVWMLIRKILQFGPFESLESRLIDTSLSDQTFHAKRQAQVTNSAKLEHFRMIPTFWKWLQQDQFSLCSNAPNRLH